MRAIINIWKLLNMIPNFAGECVASLFGPTVGKIVMTFCMVGDWCVPCVPAVSLTIILIIFPIIVVRGVSQGINNWVG